MPTKIAAGEGIPSAFYRNAIDLNRFSNATSKKLINSYNSVILKAVEQLKKIEKQPKNKQPAYKAARLRALIKQTKKSLDSWANLSVDELIADLEGVAKVQTGFIADQMKKALPSGMEQKIVNQLGYSVKSVAVSPSFAKAVVNTDPTALNISVLSDDLAGTVKPKGTFRLTAKQGQTITLPNGETVKKAFRGLAQSQAKRFNQVIRTGLLSGETTDQITRELIGTLDFGDQAKTVKQMQLAGGQVTKMANGQIATIVRTSINQVANTASQSVYKANPDITEEYRYVATLDSRTSPICRDLDGSVFKYNQGPEPPQHFGCRSTTVAVINYKKWGFDPPPVGKRASADGPVPANTTYGKWLYEQKRPKTKFEPGKEQIAALGKTKAKYFNRLANKYGPDQALKKLVRDDNTEVSLVQLQKRYGKPSDIKKSSQIKRPKIAGPGTAPLRLTKKDPLISTWDPDEALKKAQINSDKNFVGSGAFASVYKLDGNPPSVIKKGQFGRHEVEALEKLKGTGVVPKVLGEKYTTGWTKDHDFGFSYLSVREGSVVMTQAKGRPVNELLGRSNFGDYQKPKNLKQRDLMLDEYIKARKKMHFKGIAHNDMHEDNFFFDTKTNKGTVVDFGMAQVNRKAALIEAMGLGTGGDETGILAVMNMLGDRPTYSHKLLNKIHQNVLEVKFTLERRGLDSLAQDMAEWETFSNFSNPKYAALTDDLADELLKIVYTGI